MAANYENNPAIANFVEYLKIPSVQPNINYGKLTPLILFILLCNLSIRFFLFLI